MKSAAVIKKSTIQESKTDRIFLTIVYLLLFVAFLLVAYPLIYILSASISDPAVVNSGEMWLFPKEVTFEGYRTILQNEAIWRGYLNTIIYTVVGTLINLLVTIPAGYVLSREEFPLKSFFTKMMIITMFVSGGLIPSYILVNDLGLSNTMWALILPGAASVYNIVITRTFFQSTIPEELTEAALMDGASDFKIFSSIVLPLSKPILAVMALFYGVGHWNQYFQALIYIDDRKKYPLQMVLREILVLQDLSSNPSTMMSEETAMYLNEQQNLSAIIKYGVMIVATLPIIIVYPFLQKYFVKGVMIGSIKG
ncbi:carbohydrate ABC transporter permease [Desemzia sp. RIT804]|uniref:carbohydrate ABC transporter permease n=1 Tax=Desemzia sp. RIT 804 TaxID=2810209 RepID=UPI00194FA82F|nr:carbohydrate ABC transporter permease [Desemzia sp. RIT 804]MBM6615445.1 carbohydrate ABC transporter permease [Desemzia sp. RIT 804]